MVNMRSLHSNVFIITSYSFWFCLILFVLHSVFIPNFLILFFLSPPLLFIPTSLMCVCICFVELKDSSWTDHCAPFFLPASLSLSSLLSLSLSLSLEGCNATGASEAQERSLGKEEQRAVRLQPSPQCTSSLLPPPLLPSLGPLASLPSPHWPAPQIKTSDKKMGSLKKGEKEREKEVRNKPRGAERQSLCCWMAGPLCRSARNCHCVSLDPSLRGTQTQTVMNTHKTYTHRQRTCCTLTYTLLTHLQRSGNVQYVNGQTV